MENEGMKILYIDDEKAALFNFEQLFQDDFDVHTALSADQGMEILATTEIQIVISDQRMPNKTGIEFFAEVAQLYPDTVRILLTAYSEAGVIIDAINQGQVYQYITKPFETKNLKNILDKAAQNWRLKRENKLLITQLQKKNEKLIQANEELLTSNKETEESKNQIKYILQTAMDGFWMTDMNGYFINVNNAYCNMSGYTETELLTMHISDVEVNENNEDVALHIKNIIENGSDRFVSKHRRKDGSSYDVEISTVYQTEYRKAFVVFVRDITVQQQSEKALIESEERFQLLFNKAPLGYQSLNIKGCFIEVNQQWLDTLGYERDEVIGKWFGDFMPPAYQELVKVNFPKFLAQGHIHSEFEMVHKNGSIVFIAFDGRIGNDMNGNFKQTHCILQDITEKRRSEKMLLESETQFRNLANSSSTLIWTSGTDKLCNYFNETWLKFTGRTLEQEMGNGWAEGVHSEDFDRCLATYVNAFDKQEAFEMEYRLLHHSGEYKWILDMGTPNYNSNNEFIGYIGNCYDINERKENEDALKVSKEEYRNLIEFSPVAMAIIHDWKTLYFNPSAIQLFGAITESEILGKHINEFIHPDFRELAAENSKLLAENGFVQKQEQKYLKLNGAVLDVETQAKSIRFNDMPATLVVINDITERKKTEVALQESENRLSTIFKNDPTGIFIVHEKTQIIYDLNDTALKIFGLPKEEIIGKECRKFFCQAENGFCPICELGQSLDQSERVLFKPDGTKVPILKSVVPIIMNGENYLLESFIDITKVKKGEKILAESERRFRDLLSTVEMISVILDVEGNIVYCNDFLLKITDWKKEEIIGKNWFTTFIPNETTELVSAVFKNAIFNNNIELNYENIILTKNGAEILVSWNNTALYDENGKLSNIASLGVDITKRKMAEMALADSKERLQKALEVSNQSRTTLLSVLEDQLRAKETLRESEAKLSTLFNTMTEMVVMHELVFDDNGNAIDYRILDCNKTFTTITGIEKENAVGRLSTEVYGTETAPYLQEYANVALNDSTLEFNTYYPPLDKYFLISAVSSEKNKFSTISTDITSNEQIHEIIKEKNKELENYIYVASHDLRSPLVNIQGFSKRLQKQTAELTKLVTELNANAEIAAEYEKITNDDIPKSLSFILNNVTKMDTLINGLLQVSRTGRVVMSPTILDMNKLFKTILIIFDYQLKEIDATIIVNELDSCYGDTNQLNQLFSNIIGNAIKYSDKNRKLSLEISSHTKYNKVTYSIKDNGIGINERHLQKIWDVFYRVDASAAEAGEGLGLSLAKRIVDKHKGKLWAESVEGEGSIFYVELHKNKFEE